VIFGIGTDIVHVPRIQKSLDRYGVEFARKILAEEEMPAFNQSVRPANFLAKRFAVKEAMAKALGTGFRDGLHLRHIYVTHAANGKPDIVCKGKAQEMMNLCDIVNSHVSLSDETDYAIAYVILEKNASQMRTTE
jgi:holo-[acyl-carrier protein] synthase